MLALLGQPLYIVVMVWRDQRFKMEPTKVEAESFASDGVLLRTQGTHFTYRHVRFSTQYMFHSTLSLNEGKCNGELLRSKVRLL